MLGDGLSQRPRIKICGLTRVDDVQAAARCGVDALGLVFWQRSSRALSAQRAVELCAAMPALMMRVGLFMDASDAWIEEVLAQVPLHLLQFHGSESQQQCARWGRPFIKALPMAGLDARAAAAAIEQWPAAAGLVLDGHGPGEAGGSARSFQWSLVPAAHRHRVIIAGGLHPGNVAQALRESGASAVDVSSGVESAPGIKDPVLMHQFVEESLRACEY